MDENNEFSLTSPSGHNSKTNGSIKIDTGEDNLHNTNFESMIIQPPNFITVDSVKVPIRKSRMSIVRKSESESITYSWTNINVTTDSAKAKVKTESKWNLPFGKEIKETKQILKNVSGTLRPGELVAVLGSSGTGKSTLMDVLTFRNSHKLKVTGIRAINGIAVESNTITSISAYVQQMDLFMGVLTVREHLVFQAQVRMSQHISYEDRLEIVEEIIQEFGLTKCAGTQIGTRWFKGISGGEMKRLSIASEVLTDPMFMCCDEPTSGLDSNTALQVISVLKHLTTKYKTVICTVHQPSSQLFAMFDKVLLMAEGRVAFLGTAAEGLEFFNKLGYICPPMFNPADFLIEQLAIKAGSEEECLEIVTKICNAFEDEQLATVIGKLTENSVYVNVSKPVNVSRYKASTIQQFRAVMKRSFISFMRDPMVLKMRIAQTVFLGLLIGIIFYDLNLHKSEGIQNLTGALFMILSALTYQHLLAALDNYCSELPVFIREHLNGMYRTDIYYISKAIIEIPFYFILPLLFCGIIYFMIGLDPTLTSFFKTVLIMVLVTACCGALGCFLSCLAKDITVALIIAPAIIFPFFLFGGYLIRPESGPKFLVWLEDLSWIFYGFEAMAVVQLDGLRDIECSLPILLCPNTGRGYLQALNFNRRNFPRDVIALTILAVSAQVIAYLSLVFRTIRP